MILAIGADHRGSDIARQLGQRLENQGHTVSLYVPEQGASCDYPEVAHAVASLVANEKAERGVLLCGTGIGMSIAANKIDGIRAAVVHDEITAELSRAHNNANVICLSADLLGQRLIEKVVDAWLSREFEGGRHERRVEKIHAIERGEDPKSVEG